MIRLAELRKINPRLAHTIIMRQKNGTMRKLIDSEHYVCYDEEELKKWKPKKNGRPPKTFVCEICGCVTPMEFEGSEPNTCEDCMPLRADQMKGRR